MQRFLKLTKKKKLSGAVEWNNAQDIKIRVNELISSLELTWLDSSRIFCFRSNNSRARAYARIWGFSRVWQMALNEKPAYVIEVLSEKYDHLSKKNRDNILLHEIAHIPKNFSGSLLPHIRTKGSRNFEDRVHDLIAKNNKIKN